MMSAPCSYVVQKKTVWTCIDESNKMNERDKANTTIYWELVN